MLRIQIEDDCFSLKRKKCLVEGEHEEKKGTKRIVVIYT